MYQGIVDVKRQVSRLHLRSGFSFRTLFHDEQHRRQKVIRRMEPPMLAFAAVEPVEYERVWNKPVILRYDIGRRQRSTASRRNFNAAQQHRSGD